MLKRRWSVPAAAALWLLGIAAPLPAQPPPPAPLPTQPVPALPEDEAEHQALRDLKALYEQAIKEDRLDLIADYIHPDFHGVMVTSRAVNSLDELRTFWADIHTLMGEGGRYTTTVNPERSVIHGDIALARGTTDDVVVTGDGKEYRFTSQWTAVLQKDAGRWKLRRVHGTMDPIANPFVREFAQRAIIQYGIAAGIGGIALGFGVPAVIRRRRARKA
jgi:ketosteroid isomerase-like protein